MIKTEIQKQWNKWGCDIFLLDGSSNDSLEHPAETRVLAGWLPGFSTINPSYWFTQLAVPPFFAEHTWNRYTCWFREIIWWINHDDMMTSPCPQQRYRCTFFLARHCPARKAFVTSIEAIPKWGHFKILFLLKEIVRTNFWSQHKHFVLTQNLHLRQLATPRRAATRKSRENIFNSRALQKICKSANWSFKS